MIEPPIGALLELSHRCPLRCGYCSNPLELEPGSAELSTSEWCRVIDEAAELGVLQVSFSGGEPTVRDDLEALVEHASNVDLYTNLITSAVLLDEARVDVLDRAGLQHVQIGFQDVRGESGDFFAGYAGAHAKKVEVARWFVARDIPLTLNAVVHRHNVERVDEFFALALELGAHRIEIASVQYHGWATLNVGYLLPSREQLRQLDDYVEATLPELEGRLVVDFVPPDYYTRRPKACMNGWGRHFMNISPSGSVLPCHAAQTIPGLEFENVREQGLREIWLESTAFARFRGEGWMSEPCRSCEDRAQDHGGCRCQAMAIAGDAAAADPVCELSSHRGLVDALISKATEAGNEDYTYRRGERA